VCQQQLQLVRTVVFMQLATDLIAQLNISHSYWDVGRVTRKHCVRAATASVIMTMLGAGTSNETAARAFGHSIPRWGGRAALGWAAHADLNTTAPNTRTHRAKLRLPPFHGRVEGDAKRFAQRIEGERREENG
jgi:hypothetical protein